MLADVESCLDVLVGHSPFVFCKCKKKSSVILLENILGTLASWIMHGFLDPLDLKDGDDISESLSPLAKFF